MKTLLQIGSSLNCGAPGKIAEQIGLLAMSKGWDVYMAHGHRHSNPSQLNTIPMVSANDEKVHALYSLLFDRHGLGPDGKTKELVEWIRTNKPDVIHLHNIHGHFLNYKTLFEYLATVDIPIVWTFHDFWPITGHCAYFDHIDCWKWKEKCESCPQNNAYPRTLLFNRTEKNFELKKRLFCSIKRMVIAPVSKWAGTLVLDSFLSKYPVVPIYNGVDTNIFKHKESDLRMKLSAENKTILLGVASPWSERKGYSLYFKLREILSDDYVIIMVGLNDKELSELPEGIVGIKRTQNQNELAEYYSIADIVLNLSSQETFGMTTVEGMACGTPVIVINKTASPELVTAETGLVVESNDIYGIVEAIVTVKNKGKLFYSEACRRRAEEFFDKDKCFEKYIELYNKLIQ